MARQHVAAEIRHAVQDDVEIAARRQAAADLADAEIKAMLDNYFAVFVAGILFEASEADIKRSFRTIGCTVTRIEFKGQARVGKHSGVAVMQLQSRADLQRCLAAHANGQLLIHGPGDVKCRLPK